VVRPVRTEPVLGRAVQAVEHAVPSLFEEFMPSRRPLGELVLTPGLAGLVAAGALVVVVRGVRAALVPAGLAQDHLAPIRIDGRIQPSHEAVATRALPQLIIGAGFVALCLHPLDISAEGIALCYE
jgi:hypothetical protein